VAVAATVDRLTLVHLCISGLVVGGATAVGGPATRAMIADLGDQLGPHAAVRGLAWQDLAHRISMVTSPPVAAWVVTQNGALPLMWADSTGVALAALLVLPVAGYARRQDVTERAMRSAREVLRSHPLVAHGITMAGVGWYWWFAFALGLAILGVETGRPGQLVAAGMAGYGIGSLAGSTTAALVVARLPRMPTIMAAWIVLGGVFLTLPSLTSSVFLLVGISAVGGLVSPFGITALNALITEHTNGSDRRTAFASQQIAGTGGASLGMLSGGAVIGLVGPGTTMYVAGSVLIALPLVFLVRARKVHRRLRNRADVGEPSLVAEETA
jgi:predicted MFS family arabinose efflux permease